MAQNTQRAILATVAKEAALLTPIVDHSFANVAYGAASVRYFRKVNMGILRNRFLGVTENMNLSAKGAGAVPNALKISEGSLTAFSSAYQNSAVCFYQNGALQEQVEVSVDEFKRAYPYLQGGDQLTLVKIVKTAGSLENGDATFALKVDRVVFASNAFDIGSVDAITDEGYINSNILDLSKTTNTSMLTAINGGGGIGLGVNTETDNTYAAALILSRKVNNVWQRSTQYLEMTESDDWTDIATAIESYGATSSLSDATEYLNQADESTPAGGVSGSYLMFDGLTNGVSVTSDTVDAGQISTVTMSAAVGDDITLKANGFAASGTRVVAVDIAKPDNSLAAHGAKSAILYTKMSADIAGVWKIFAVFADGTRAEFDVTLQVGG